MENFKIQNQGNLNDIDPKLIAKWRKSTNFSNQDVTEKTNRERQMLMKLVSRMGSKKKGDELWNTGQVGLSFHRGK